MTSTFENVLDIGGCIGLCLALPAIAGRGQFSLFEQAGIGNTSFFPLVETCKLVPSLQSAALHIVPQALDVANYAIPSKLFSIMSDGRPYAIQLVATS
jgi:hypothetical protein